MNVKISIFLISLLLLAGTSSAEPEVNGGPDKPQPNETTGSVNLPGSAIALFEPDEAMPAIRKALPGVTRSRQLKIQTAKFHKNKLQAGRQITFDTFDGNALVGVIERVDSRDNNKYSWYGRIVGQPESSFNIVVEEGVMVGNINPQGVLPFEIRYEGTANNHTLREVVYDGSIGCGVESKHRRGSMIPSVSTPLKEAMTDELASPEISSAPPVLEDSGYFIDVLFVYTTGAETEAGGQAAIHAIVQLSVDTTNTAYSLSNVGQRIRLAGRRSTTYSETGGTFENHLARLKGETDGNMDAVHDWRDDYQADLVALIIDDTDGDTVFGLAYIIGGPSDEEFGFSVTDQAYAASAQNWSLAHELGHNMGSAHDHAQGAGGITNYAVGHLFTGDTQGSLRTIMARRALGGTRIQRFSNPTVNFDAQPTGIAIGLPDEADNRSAFAVSDSNVANYRSELPFNVWVDFSYGGPSFLGTDANPFNNITDAENLVRWGGTIIIKASSFTGAGTYAMGANKAYKIDTVGGTAIMK